MALSRMPFNVLGLMDARKAAISACSKTGVREDSLTNLGGLARAAGLYSSRADCWQVRGRFRPRRRRLRVGVIASGAYGSRNGADEPCFARGQLLKQPLNLR